MTNEFERGQAEYKIQRDVLLSRVPSEFRKGFGRYAWENGHAHGYSDVLILLEDLVELVEEPLRDYQSRLLSEARESD